MYTNEMSTNIPEEIQGLKSIPCPRHHKMIEDAEIERFAITEEQIQYCRKNNWTYKNTSSICVNLAVHHPIQIPALRKLVQNALVIRILVRYGDGTVFVTGNILEIWKRVGWAWIDARSQLIFRVLWEQTYAGMACQMVYPRYVMGSSVSQQLPLTPLCLCFEADGPLVDDVRVYLGKDDKAVRLTNCDGRDILVSPERCSDTLCPELATDGLKKMWLNKKYSSLGSIDLTDPTYYEKHLVEYSVWSFPLHMQQMGKLLRDIPNDYILIAPGDGLGLVRRLWKGITISGDLCVTSLTYPGVERESMVETVHRGLSLPGKKIVVLSYCQQFFSDSEIQWLFSLGLPIVIVEAARSITTRVPGLINHNLGIYSYRTDLKFDHVNAYDFSSDPQVVLFSENLLSNPGYWVASDNIAVDYLMMMRPESTLGYARGFKGVKKYPEKVQKDVGNPSVALAYNVSEGRDLVEKYERVYFYPTGKSYVPPIIIGDVRGSLKLDPRVLYGVSKGSPLAQQISQTSGFFVEELDDMYYFSYVKEKDMKLSLKIRTQTELGLKVQSLDLFFSERKISDFYPNVQVSILQNGSNIYEIVSSREGRSEVSVDVTDELSIRSFMYHVGKWHKSDRDYVKNFIQSLKVGSDLLKDESNWVQIERHRALRNHYLVYVGREEAREVDMDDARTLTNILALPDTLLSHRGKAYVSSYFVNVAREMSGEPFLHFSDFPSDQILILRNGQKMPVAMVHSIRSYYPYEDKDLILNIFYESKKTIQEVIRERWPKVLQQ